jgi:hypothetical protein
MGEFSTFLVVNLGEEFHPNSPRLYLSFTVVFCQKYSFQQPVILQKVITPKTVDRRRASKYPLESRGSSLPLWYSTPGRISDRTTPYFNLLTAACSEGQIDVVIEFFSY